MNISNKALMARLLLEGFNCASCAENYNCSYAPNPQDICCNYINIKDFWDKQFEEGFINK